MLTAADLIIDPELRARLRPLTADELSALKVSLGRFGFLSPLVAWKGLIVDGHHRYDVWDQLYRDDPDRAPDVTELPSKLSRDEVLTWIDNNQAGRRNELTKFQRAEQALGKKGEVAADARRRMADGAAGGSPNPDDLGRTDEKLAREAGIGKTALREVEEVLELGSPELIEAARSGEVSIHAAHQQVRAPREKASKPADPVRASEDNAAREMSRARRYLDQFFGIVVKLQDDDRRTMAQELSERLGTLEKAE